MLPLQMLMVIFGVSLVLTGKIKLNSVFRSPVRSMLNVYYKITMRIIRTKKIGEFSPTGEENLRTVITTCK